VIWFLNALAGFCLVGACVELTQAFYALCCGEGRLAGKFLVMAVFWLILFGALIR